MYHSENCLHSILPLSLFLLLLLSSHSSFARVTFYVCAMSFKYSTVSLPFHGGTCTGWSVHIESLIPLLITPLLFFTIFHFSLSTCCVYSTYIQRRVLNAHYSVRQATFDIIVLSSYNKFAFGVFKISCGRNKIRSIKIVSTV